MRKFCYETESESISGAVSLLSDSVQVESVTRINNHEDINSKNEEIRANKWNLIFNISIAFSILCILCIGACLVYMLLNVLYYAALYFNLF